MAQWGRGQGAVGLEGVDEVMERLNAGPCREPRGGNHGPKGRGPPGLSWLWKVLVAVQWSTIRGNLSTGTCPENGMCLAFGAKEDSGQGTGTMGEGEPGSKALTTRGRVPLARGSSSLGSGQSGQARGSGRRWGRHTWLPGCWRGAH